MKRKLLILGIIILSIINIATLVTFGYHKWSRHRQTYCSSVCPRSKSFLYRELSLSDEQIQQIETLKETFQNEINPLREDIKKKREEIVHLLMFEEPETSSIDTLINEIQSIQAQIQKQVIYHLIAEKNILTKEQQEKFIRLISERLIKENSHHETDDFNVECDH